MKIEIEKLEYENGQFLLRRQMIISGLCSILDGLVIVLSFGKYSPSFALNYSSKIIKNS